MPDGSRRRFLLGGAAAALPVLSRAQRPPGAVRPGFLPRIAVVIGGDGKTGDSHRFLHEFREGMRELGYQEGGSYVLEVRAYGSDPRRVAALADPLLALEPDVLVANVSSTAAILRRRTSRVPIVMVTALDPVGEGLAATLARPGGNVTGLTSLSHELDAKLVELARELVPGLKRLAFLVNPAHAISRSREGTAARAAAKFGLELTHFEVRVARDVDRLAERLSAAQIDALLVAADAVLFGLREPIIEAALGAGVPTIASLPDFAAQGALASYGADVAASFRAAGRYVDRILKGAKAAELPIEQPTQFELVLNLKTARALHLAVPKEALLRADRVIE